MLVERDSSVSDGDILDADVRHAAAAFAMPDTRRSAVRLVTSFGPFVASCVLMHLVTSLAPLVPLALALPTGALRVRVFIVQHDCGHALSSRRVALTLWWDESAVSSP
jgi:acyl-lipid omega-6 desaturase (Delta-12 desaturase)